MDPTIKNKFIVQPTPWNVKQRSKILKRIYLLSYEKYQLMLTRASILESRYGGKTQKDEMVLISAAKDIFLFNEEMNFLHDTCLAAGIPDEYIREFYFYNRECWEEKTEPKFPGYLHAR